MAATFLAARFRRCIAVPDHSDYGYDHANDNLYIETLFSKEQESQDQNKDGFHVAEYLERHRCESANADELAQVGPYCNCAWKA